MQVNPASIIIVAIHNLCSYPAQAQHAMQSVSLLSRYVCRGLVWSLRKAGLPLWNSLSVAIGDRTITVMDWVWLGWVRASINNIIIHMEDNSMSSLIPRSPPQLMLLQVKCMMYRKWQKLGGNLGANGVHECRQKLYWIYCLTSHTWSNATCCFLYAQSLYMYIGFHDASACGRGGVCFHWNITGIFQPLRQLPCMSTVVSAA